MQSSIARNDPGQLVEKEAEQSDQGILQVSSPEQLGRIHDPSVELVIWKRSLPGAFGQWLDSLSGHQLPFGRVLVGEAEMRPAIKAILEASAAPGDEMRSLLMEDVLTLARLFMRTMNSKVVDIRLEAINHDSCWRFHRDFVAARMLTSYRGPGTEWVRPGDSTAALTQQKNYQGKLERFPQHAVGLFKGSRAEPAGGIVHRSPPVASTGTTRLLLCLNLPSAASPDPWVP